MSNKDARKPAHFLLLSILLEAHPSIPSLPRMIGGNCFQYASLKLSQKTIEWQKKQLLSQFCIYHIWCSWQLVGFSSPLCHHLLLLRCWCHFNEKMFTHFSVTCGWRMVVRFKHPVTPRDVITLTRSSLWRIKNLNAKSPQNNQHFDHFGPNAVLHEWHVVQMITVLKEWWPMTCIVELL